MYIVYCRVVYKCIDCSEPSGVGFDPVICMCNVLLTLYLYLYHLTLCALCAGPMYQPLPCPCVPTSVQDLHAYSVRYFNLISNF